MGEMLLSELGLYNARPTLRVGGRQDARADRLLRSLLLAEQDGGLASLRAGFVDWDSREDGSAGHAFEDEALIALGTELAVYGGEVAAPTELFRGKVSALEFAADPDGPPRLTVYAEDALAAARLTRRIEVHENKSVADIARSVAQRAGLTPQVDGLADVTDTWFQCNESDLAFLRRLLARFGADAQVVGRELHVAARDQVHRADVELRLHSQLQRVRVVADLAQQCTELRVTGFDAAQGQAVEGLGSAAPLGPGRGRRGADELRRAFAAREEQVAHLVAHSSAEAQALARAAFAARSRGFVRVQGVAEGNPALRVGCHVALRDLSPRLDNTYYVTACEHRWDVQRGYETEFSAECAYLGEPA